MVKLTGWLERVLQGEDRVRGGGEREVEGGEGEVSEVVEVVEKMSRSAWWQSERSRVREREDAR